MGSIGIYGYFMKLIIDVSVADKIRLILVEKGEILKLVETGAKKGASAFFLEKFDALYLSLDIDVFDPALAPGTD